MFGIVCSEPKGGDDSEPKGIDDSEFSIRHLADTLGALPAPDSRARNPHPLRLLGAGFLPQHGADDDALDASETLIEFANLPRHVDRAGVGQGFWKRLRHGRGGRRVGADSCGGPINAKTHNSIVDFIRSRTGKQKFRQCRPNYFGCAVACKFLKIFDLPIKATRIPETDNFGSSALHWLDKIQQRLTSQQINFEIFIVLINNHLNLNCLTMLSFLRGCA
jgi:hypothetical protein